MANKIKSLRLAEGFTQQQVAICCGMTERHLAAIERNEIRNPGHFTLRRIAAFLGVNVDELGYEDCK